MPFSRLLVANRSILQNEDVLVPHVIPPSSSHKTIQRSSSTQPLANPHIHGIGTQLPFYSRLLLVAAYLASYNSPKTDQIFFMKNAAAKKKKKGGGTALKKGRIGAKPHRKISRNLLGPQAFVLERMLAIFHAIKEDADKSKRLSVGKDVTAGSSDIQMAIATLATSRLMTKVGVGAGVDVLDGGSKYRVAVGWEVVRGVARSVGIEVEDYLGE